MTRSAPHPVFLFLISLLVFTLLLAALAGAFWALWPGTTLSRANADRLAAAVGSDPKALLNVNSAHVALSGLVGTWSRSAALDLGENTVAGLYSVSSYRGQASFELHFSGLADARRFRERLASTLGPPEQACSTDTVAHWSLKPGLSALLAVWRGSDDRRATADLIVSAHDPLDVNCPRNAFGKQSQYDDGKLRAFLTALKAEPPPLADADALQRWLSRFGTVRADRRDGCEVFFTVDDAALLPGFGGLYAHVAACNDDDPSGSYLQTGQMLNDLIASRKVEQAASDVLGTREQGCVGPQYRLAADSVAKVDSTPDSVSLLVLRDRLTADCRQK